MAMKDPQARTKQIIKDDIETIRAYADAFGVEMPDLDENGEVVGLPAPYPREVAGVVRSGYRIYELGQKAVETGMPCLNPILGRNSAEETWKESNDIYKYAEKFGQTVFQFVHSEATRHIDPLKGRELIEQSRGKGGITPKGEREFIQMGGGAFAQVGYYFDPTVPTKEMANAAATAAGQAPLLWLGAVVVGALVPLVCCVLARKKGDAAVWKAFGAVAVVAGVAGAICLRVAFYNMGLSVFMFY